MDILCPKHHVPMQIEQVEFELLGNKAYIAKCPQCECRYVDRYVFKSTPSITVSGIRYEFLPELSACTEKLREKEQEEIEKNLREKEILEQEKLKAEAKKLKQQRKEEKQKRKWKEAEEKRRLYLDSETARLKTLFRDSPDHFYRATFVSYYDGAAPKVCPIDGEQLIYLNNAHYRGYKGGLCCLRCSRMYLPKGEQPPQEKSKSSSKKKLSSAETIAQNLKLQEENPSRSIKPFDVLYYSNISLRRCISDHTDLIEVNNITINRKRDISGLWCPLCNRCYIKETPPAKKHIAQNKTSATNNNDANQSDHPNESRKPVADWSHLPKSTILAVKLQNLSSKDDIFSVTIVTNEHEQDANRKILWMGRALPSYIMIVLQTSADKEFTFKSQKYRILEVKKFPNSSKYLQIVSRFCNPSAPQPIYVFSQKNIPSYASNDFECVTAMIPCANNSFPIPLTVYFQKSTHTYFINEATYTEARVKYGLPYLRLRTPENTSLTGDYIKKLKPHSMLNLLGYSVSCVDGLSAQSRHVLLANIINSKIMSKSDIVNHIEWLIHSRAYMDHMENAVAEWKDDLRFLMGFNADYQRTIYASSLRAKHASVKF